MSDGSFMIGTQYNSPHRKIELINISSDGSQVIHAIHLTNSENLNNEVFLDFALSNDGYFYCLSSRISYFQVVKYSPASQTVIFRKVY